MAKIDECDDKLSDKKNRAAESSFWSLYIVQMANGNLYTGIATDVVRRFAEHQASGPKAARALRGKGPLTLVFQQQVGNRSQAQSAEYRVKQLARAEKLLLIKGQQELLAQCFPAQV